MPETMLADPIESNGFFSTLILILVVTFLYVATGYLGLFVSTPPGFATAIWIPSGIALGATLVWGLRVIPGVFLGSLLTTFFISSTATIADVPTAFLASSLIACGSMTQTIAGWYLIKRWVGKNNLLQHPNDIFYFVLAGPISCLINATWSNFVLYGLEILPASAFGLNWFTWWIGDSMGVLIFTPAFLILFDKPSSVWHQRIIPILLPLLLTFAAVVSICSFMHVSELNRIKSNFSRQIGTELLQTANDIYRAGHINNIKPAQLSNIINNNFIDKRRYYAIRIVDVTNLSKIHDVYVWQNDQMKPPAGNYYFTFNSLIDIGNNKWVVSAAPSSNYVNFVYSRHLGLVLISSLLFCALISMLLFILNGQKTLAQSNVAENINALKREESKNLQILQAAGEGIFGIDKNGHTTFINPAGAKMLGFEESEMIGRAMHDLIHHSHPDGNVYFASECPIYSAYRHNQVHHITNEVFWRKDGTSFWVDYTVTPMRDGQNTVGAVVIFDDVTERKAIESELKTMAHFDSLTLLPNRANFFQYLAMKLQEAKDHDKLLAVCFLDLDDFKRINDTLGHDVGDQALKQIAALLQETLRENDQLARIGGDEFGIIITNIKDENDIVSIITRFIHALKNPLTFSNTVFHVSMTIGVAVYPSGGTTATELVKNADIAMYHAKEQGKGTYALFDEALHQKISKRQKIDSQLQTALDHNEFYLEYQPQVNAHNKHPSGIEALLRWNNKEMGDVLPQEFIHVAESNGLIPKIGEWVLRKACEDYKKLIANPANSHLTISVNLSILQLTNPLFLKTLSSILQDTKMPQNKLILEMTETALIKNTMQINEILTEAKKLNVSFILDDFGIRYSAMQYLKNLPISGIKIDHSFVQDMISNVSDFEIVNATIRLALGMGINCIAEGVETEEQYQLLKKLGCGYMQGYLFGKAMRLEALEEFLNGKYNPLQ